MTKVATVQGLPKVLAQHQCNALRHVVVERLCHARHGAVPEECHRTRRSQTTCWVSQALPLRRNYVEVQLAKELWLIFFLWQPRLMYTTSNTKNILYSSISPSRTIKSIESHAFGELHHCTTALHTGHSEHMNQRLHTEHTQTHI